MSQPLFKNRADGGKQLGKKLKELKLVNLIVLAIPRGGVPVGLEVAKALNCPFDFILARKIQFPWTAETGFGAVAEDGSRFLSIYAEGLPQEVIETQTKKAREEIERRKKQLLKDQKGLDLKGKTVILVDDGLAAGSTMAAAIVAAKKKKPVKIIAAAPTASSRAIKLLEKKADQVVTLYQHPEGLDFAVADAYQEWHDLTDKEVKNLLSKPR